MQNEQQDSVLQGHHEMCNYAHRELATRVLPQDCVYCYIINTLETDAAERALRAHEAGYALGFKMGSVEERTRARDEVLTFLLDEETAMPANHLIRCIAETIESLP